VREWESGVERCSGERETGVDQSRGTAGLVLQGTGAAQEGHDER
jgi:hypothetical protein